MTTVALGALGALPSHAVEPRDAPAAAGAASGPIDPPLYDETADGGTVRVNVVTENRTDLSTAATAGRTLRSFDTLPVVTLKVGTDGLDRLASQPGVVSVTEDIAVPPSRDDSVALTGAAPAAAPGRAGRAAAAGDGAGSAIAVLDTGVATHHPYLKDRIVAEACFSPVDADSSASSLCPNGTEQQEGPGTADSEAGPCAAMAGCDHGTHVAGIAAGDGAGLAGAPASGVAPGAGIVAIQVFSKFDSEDYCGGPDVTPCVLSYTSAQIAALEKVMELRQAGTPVIAANLSLGAGRYATACDGDPRGLAVDLLLGLDVTTVVAAGNNAYGDAVSAPACIASAVAVGSTTADDELSSFSNRGALLDLLARGTGVVSSVPGGGYASKNGTSMAAPQVAGAFAVLRQAFPEESAARLESRLKAGGRTISYTGGSTPRLDITGALGDTGQPAPGITDFNCDRIEDLAVADPEATVGGDARAGLVRIVYGGGKGTSEVHQDLAAVPGDAEANDYFGEALATVDHDGDGCTDLVVGTPREDLGSQADAGTVDVMYGASGGLASGGAAEHLEQGTGTGDILAAASEAGDRMGAAVAAGLTDAGEPYLVIGVPGEDVDGKADAGGAFYLRGSVNRALVQGKAGVAGTPEAGDKYGSSVAGAPEHLVIGVPGEGMVPSRVTGTTEVVAGQVDVMAHQLNSDGVPLHRGSIDQNSFRVTAEVEAGDQFGAAVSAAPGRFTRGVSFSFPSTYIAIGVPGEDITYGGAARADAGRVVVVRITEGWGLLLNQVNNGYDQGPDDVVGSPEAGDRMGAAVTVVNRTPGPLATAASLVMAVGVPGEDVGTVADAGAVSVFGLVGEPGANDRWIEAGNPSGMPGAPGAGRKTGTSLHGTPTRLYVGMPYGPGAYGSLYAMTWTNVTGGGAQPVTTYAPGTGGLPAAGLRFGMTAR